MIAGQTANTKLVLGYTFVKTIESKFDCPSRAKQKLHQRKD